MALKENAQSVAKTLRLVIDYDTLEAKLLSAEEAQLYLAERPDNWLYAVDEGMLTEVNSALESVKDTFRGLERVLAKAEVQFG
jgi:hypothetical protein